jgi:hypothetical protein
MTGDWGGDRVRLKEKGFEIELSLTQFYQGIADGGIRSGSEYNGIFKTNFKFDLGNNGGMAVVVGPGSDGNSFWRTVAGRHRDDKSG